MSLGFPVYTTWHTPAVGVGYASRSGEREATWPQGHLRQVLLYAQHTAVCALPGTTCQPLSLMQKPEAEAGTHWRWLPLRRAAGLALLVQPGLRAAPRHSPVARPSKLPRQV